MLDGASDESPEDAGLVQARRSKFLGGAEDASSTALRRYWLQVISLSRPPELIAPGTVTATGVTRFGSGFCRIG
jgi:hypothetical protein